MPLSMSMDEVLTKVADDILFVYGDFVNRDALIRVIQRSVQRSTPPQLVDLQKELAGRWRLVEDQDGHWYMIPAEKLAAFNDWTDDMMDGVDEIPEDFEQYRLPGSPEDVTFTDPDRTI